MARRKTKLHKDYVAMSTERLMCIFDNISVEPTNRVKRTGCVKLSAAKFGDLILDEVRRRRDCTPV